MYCKELSKALNGDLKCKKYKKHIKSLEECKNCSDFILMRNKGIKKVSKKRIFVKKEIYEQVYKRDKGRCRLCGNTNIQLHHIIYRSERKDLVNEPTNCIMLCTKHHKEVHSNKHYWQSKLKEMINK
jgi:5-methylcytosine-specific restriction endonuclease McrA